MAPGPRLAVLAMLLGGGAAPLSLQAPVPHDPPVPSPNVAFATSGGEWRTADSHGHYRLLVLRDALHHLPCLLLIEWIELAGPGAAVVESHVVSVIGYPWRLEQPTFAPVSRTVQATVLGHDDHAGHQASWIITLGAPGIFSVSPVRP